MLNAFDANAPKVPKHVTVMYLRDDVHTRRERTKCGCVNQLETQVRVTAKATTKPLKQGSHYGAWNDGNAIVGVRLCDNTSPMVMTGDRESATARRSSSAHTDSQLAEWDEWTTTSTRLPARLPREVASCSPLV